MAAKYGKSKNVKQRLNAAIRAELAGGNAALDALEAARQRLERNGSADNEAAYNWAQNIVSAMAAEIRQRYRLPPRED